jgi:putative ABC transport system substrate-binding protein
MRRREFLTILGGAAAASPFRSQAQQMVRPVVGLLGADAPDQYADRLQAFREGLKEAGYREGENLTVEYRWAEGKNDEMPALAAELARLNVSAIVALGSTPAALAAKGATTTIPVIFFVGTDPIRLGLVASLARPGGNLTGVTTLNEELISKRVELLHEAIPATTSIALLVNPTNPSLAEPAIKEAETATRRLGLTLNVLHASAEREFDTVFAALTKLQDGALVIVNDAFFLSRGEQLGTLAVRHSVPAIFSYRLFTAAGGLMSYGTPVQTYSLAGIYTGRILKGEKPSDLPVQQATIVELIINTKSAKALGITLPLSLLGRADEVIE